VDRDAKSCTAGFFPRSSAHALSFSRDRVAFISTRAVGRFFYAIVSRPVFIDVRYGAFTISGTSHSDERGDFFCHGAR